MPQRVMAAKRLAVRIASCGGTTDLCGAVDRDDEHVTDTLSRNGHIRVAC